LVIVKKREYKSFIKISSFERTTVMPSLFDISVVYISNFALLIIKIFRACYQPQPVFMIVKLMRMSQFFSAHHFISKWWANDKSIFHSCAYVKK